MRAFADAISCDECTRLPLLLETRSWRVYSSFAYKGLIADEATDISHNEQMCISIRLVVCWYEIHEDPLGLVQLPDTKAETLFSVIKDVLIRCSLPIVMCRGQAYGGASNMSGIRNGVQALVKCEASCALYVYCFAQFKSVHTRSLKNNWASAECHGFYIPVSTVDQILT